MQFLDYNQVLTLFKENAVQRFVVEKQNQHLRKYHANQIVTLHTKKGTFLTEARVEEQEKTRKIQPPKKPLREYTCTGEECCFLLPTRRVCTRDPTCTQRSRETDFCKIQKAYCQDAYHQYKYICSAIHDGAEIFGEEKIGRMSLTELNAFIRDASACHDARYAHIKSCPAFDNKKHRAYLSVLEHRITLAYQEKIAKELLSLSEENKILLTHIIPALDKQFIWTELKSSSFFYHVKMYKFTREELNYLFLLHLRAG